MSTEAYNLRLSFSYRGLTPHKLIGMPGIPKDAPERENAGGLALLGNVNSPPGDPNSFVGSTDMTAGTNNMYNTFNTFTALLAIGALIALVVMIVSFIEMIFRWKTTKRRGHVIRLLLATAAIPCLIGIQQAVLWLVLLPALGRKQMADINAGRATKLADTSLVHVGDPAPNFSLTTADGDDFSLSDAKDDVVLINFFATWCGPCQIELPHIDQIWADNRGNDDFRLLVIGREESLESVRQYRDKNGFSFPIAADPDRAVYSLFADELIPRTLVVSPDGLVVYSKAGFYEADLIQLKAVLKEQLAALLPKSSDRPEMTPANPDNVSNESTRKAHLPNAEGGPAGKR